ncbi:saccharopine dehydrogenase NADP-binding domain-containing protein [Streptomyces sp. Tue6028]|uniref:saccharopine dehydrogenase NADP-binding domain-containing protein n=1 Tax=Streptomyces sp. Tue6028 TaxID=2036037 RepID=UPI003EBDD168
MTARRIVVIGAASATCRAVVDRLARSAEDLDLTLCDVRPDLVELWARRLPVGRVTVRHLDLRDRRNLLSVIDGAALVVLGAGPYPHTAGYVRTACIEARVAYLDFADDAVSTQSALTLDPKAREAGVPLFIGCGASPGLNSMLVVDATRELDSVDRIDMCWMVGDEHADAGPTAHEILAHVDGPATDSPSDTRPESPHPAAITMPRRYPETGHVHIVGRPDPWRQDGPSRPASAPAIPEIKVLTRAEAPDHASRPLRLSLLARVTGSRDGKPAVVTRRTPASNAQSHSLRSEASLTATSCSAFIMLALDQGCGQAGVLAPEDWADPEAFYTALERAGADPAEIVESVI